MTRRGNEGLTQLQHQLREESKSLDAKHYAEETRRRMAWVFLSDDEIDDGRKREA